MLVIFRKYASQAVVKFKVEFYYDKKIWLTVRTLNTRRHFIFDNASSPGHLGQRNTDCLLKLCR